MRQTLAAAYPMYAVPETAHWVDLWWQGLKKHLHAAGIKPPCSLSVPKDLYQHWMQPNLLLSQTCADPFTHGLKDKVQYVATPTYTSTYSEQENYCSLILVNASNPAVNLADLRGGRVAYNGVDSQSGYHSLRAAVAPLSTVLNDGSCAKTKRFFSSAKESGGHRESMGHVQDGRADVCAVDCVTYALLEKHVPHTIQGLRILQSTDLAPGLPWITSQNTSEVDKGKIVLALNNCYSDPYMKQANEQLMMGPPKVVDVEQYEKILTMEQQAKQLGYVGLA